SRFNPFDYDGYNAEAKHQIKISENSSTPGFHLIPEKTIKKITKNKGYNEKHNIINSKKKFEQPTLQGLIAKKYSSDYVSIIKIFNKDYFFIPDPKTGRIYHNIANLPRSLKRFIYNTDNPNELLINLDIKNSQPFLLNPILIKKYPRPESRPPDVELYIGLTSLGNFYEYMMEALGIPFEDRDKSKISSSP